MVKWKHWSLQNSYARVRFPLRPQFLLDIWVLFGNNGYVERDNRGGHNRKKVNEDFFKAWSPKMAYVLGFIYADGAVENCLESSRACYLSIANNDFDILMDIRSAMSGQQTIHVRYHHMMKINGKEFWCQISYFMRIGNKLIYNDLIGLGLCQRKSLVIQMPNVPEKYFSYFLRGYFDGDGCISIGKPMDRRLDVIFTSGSKIFLEQLANKILGKFPLIKSSISFGYGAFRLRYNWRNAVDLAGFIYQNIGQAPYLKYKYVKYQDHLKV